MTLSHSFVKISTDLHVTSWASIWTVHEVKNDDDYRSEDFSNKAVVLFVSIFTTRSLKCPVCVRRATAERHILPLFFAHELTIEKEKKNQ